MDTTKALSDEVLVDGTPVDPRNYLFSNRITDESKLSLWNDPRWSRAKSQMSKEQIEHYATMGEQMNGSIDYTTGKSNQIPIPEPVQTSIAYILSGLRSGLEPSDLDENEINTLESFIGKDWQKKLSIAKVNSNDNSNNTGDKDSDEGNSKC